MIVALVDPGAPPAALREVAAGCEEEGVPFEADAGAGRSSAGSRARRPAAPRSASASGSMPAAAASCSQRQPDDPTSRGRPIER